MEKQSVLNKYLSIYRYHSSFGRIEALKRMYSIFSELDRFDFKYGFNTRQIKVKSLAKKTYMPYWPVFTSVVVEMIKFGFNYYISAIRYSDLERKTVFVDFGAGLGKSTLVAAMTGQFAVSSGVEIDDELVQLAQTNLSNKKLHGSKSFITQGNVESEEDIRAFVTKLVELGVNPADSTLFIFNKNSYGPEVLANSLKLIEQHFSSIVYLYQNPIHGYVLLDLGYIEFGQDDKKSTAHKNYKYRLFFKHRYS
jgi:hypothetical protein